MKNHLYLLAALATILSMVAVGCATSAPTASREEPAPEEPTRPQSTAMQTHQEERIMATTNGVPHTFELEGVIVVTPEGYSVEPADFGLLRDTEMPADSRFLRPVFSFELYEGEGEEKDKVTDPPPIDIWVRWTAADAKLAKKRPDLVIDWDDGSGWHRVQNVNYYPPGPHALGGIAHKRIEEWGGEDPRFGWAD